MTYQDALRRREQVDPTLTRREPFRTDTNNNGMWIAGLVGLFLVLGLVFWGMNRNTSDTAMTNTRPAATTTTTTTGSGATPSTIPNNPSGTAPQKDTNQPAPSPSPNR